jgi:putative addiction module component (TIGR02574 family)
MTTLAEQVTRQALELEENDRAAIAARLLASLEQEDPGELAAFGSELERRALEMESGAVEGIAWEDLEARLTSMGRSES